ncbi:glycosyltransferase [Brachybacterium sp. DNPG3]
MTNESSRVALTTALLAVPPTYFVTQHAESLLPRDDRFSFHAVPLAASVAPGATSIAMTPALRLPLPYSVQKPLAKFAMPIQTAIVTRMRPDLIHQHHGTWSGGAVRAAASLGVPLVTTLHGTDVVHAGREAPRGLQRVHAQQVRGAFEHSQLLLAVSDHQRRLALSAGAPADRLHVNYQGVDTAFFAPAPASAEDSGGADSRPLRLLYVGGLIPRKRVDLVIGASQELAREVPHELVIVGGGPLEQELRAQAADDAHIRFVGPTDRDGVRAHMREADVLLLLSYAEGAGLVLLEAQACGLAAVVSGGDGKAEMVEDGVSGTVLAADPEPRDVARALRAWLPDSAAMRTQIGAAARAFVVGQRSVEAGADRLAEFYEQLLR